MSIEQGGRAASREAGMNKPGMKKWMIVAAAGATLLLAAPASASDASVAKTLVITAADLGAPPGAGSPNPTDPTLYGKLSKCTFGKAPKRPVTTFDGKLFTSSVNGDSLSSSVDVVKSKSQFKTDVKLYTSSKLPDCYKQYLQGVLPAGDSVVYVNTSSAPLLKPAFKGTFINAIDVQVQTPRGFEHVVGVAIGKGRAEIFTTLQTGSGNTNVSELTQPLQKVNARLKKAKL